MTWAEFTAALYAMLEFQDPSGMANYNLILPRMLDDAEGRMFRDSDLDFLVTRTTDRTQTTVAGSRNVTIPPQFVIVEDVALITPANTQPNIGGAQRIPLTRTTRQFIDFTWPQETQTQPPDPLNGGYWAVFNENQVAVAPAPPEPIAGVPGGPSAIVISPTPDDVYVTEFRGTYRPERFDLVAGFDPATGIAITPTATTFLSTYLPDLYLAAVMVVSSGYQHNFGAQSDDPRMALSWDAHYETLKRGASVEEARKKSSIEGFSAYPPNPTLRSAATPPPPPAAMPQPQ